MNYLSNDVLGMVVKFRGKSIAVITEGDVKLKEGVVLDCLINNKPGREYLPSYLDENKIV